MRKTLAAKQGTTKKNGLFAIPILIPVNYRMVLSRTGLSSISRKVEIKEGELELGTLRLEGTEPVAGRFFDRDGKSWAL